MHSSFRSITANATATKFERVEFIVLDDPETVQLGRAILKLFDRSQWIATKTEQMPFWFPLAVGVHLEIKESPGPDCCQGVRDAFKELGVSDVPLLTHANGNTLPIDHFRIVIGKRRLEEPQDQRAQ